ncbi:hypothetical protein EAG_10688 [Camponotus floridanus]|uniref:Uncharacterized protein n=1 Tax=Camponotus floridanus TaxID=104421 RepID=E2AEM9_CAMFO|nr:hypothetical protein EAG_10688 [Camponotus floridanus]
MHGNVRVLVRFGSRAAINDDKNDDVCSFCRRSPRLVVGNDNAREDGSASDDSLDLKNWYKISHTVPQTVQIILICWATGRIKI